MKTLLRLIASLALASQLYAADLTLSAGLDAFLATPSSANFATAVSGETGTGALVFGTSPVFLTNFDLEATGVRFSASNGSLTLLGLGDGADESIKLDFNTTTNTLLVTSASGVTLIDMGSIGLTVGDITGGALTVTSITNNLSVFAATTSAQFKGVISDENAPDGASSKVIMALGSLSIASGKTLTSSNTLTLAGTDATTLTFQGTDTYVGRATTDTLTNKTLTSPTINGGTFTGGTDIVVADGGTGVSSLTAYAPVFGGTTSTAAVQSGTVGTAGQVLTSNGAGALPTFQAAAGGGGGFALDDMQTSTPLLVDDFLNNVGHASIPTGPLGFIQTLNSTGTVTSTNGTATAPGWIRFSDGSSTTGGAGIITSITNLRFGTGTFTVEWRFTTPAAASDGTNTYSFRLGFMDAISSAAATDGCYLQYSSASANFRYITRQAGTETDTDSTLAFAASTTYRVRIVCDTNSAAFTINGGSAADISTNFPTGTQYTGIGACLISTAGTDATVLDVDYCAFKATGLTR